MVPEYPQLSTVCGQCILVPGNLCLRSMMASQSLSRLIISDIMAFSCGYIATEFQKQYSQSSTETNLSFAEPLPSHVKPDFIIVRVQHRKS